MLHCLERGDGPRRTVLLHGFLGSGRNLASLARAWSGREPARSFLLPDLTGHGRSPALPPDGNLETLAEDVLRTCDARGWRDFELLGHSLGGRVGLALLGRAPERVAALTLLDITPAPVSVPTTPALLSRLLAAPDSTASRGELRERLIGGAISPASADWLLMHVEKRDERYVWRIDRSALNRFYHREMDRDLTPLLETAPARVRLVYGADSAYIPGPALAHMRGLGCAVEAVPGAGHFVHVDNLPGLVAALSRGTPGAGS